jgi:Fe-S cluster assembly protein SufD
MDMEQLSKEQKEPAWMLETRKEALQNYVKLPHLAYHKYGIGIGLNVSGLHTDDLYDPESSFFVKTSENEAVEVMSLQTALKKIPQELEQYLFSTLSFIEKDKLTYLHSMCRNNLLVVRVPENSHVEKFHIATRIDSGSLFQHILIITKKNSSITIIDHSTSKNMITYSKHVEIIAEKDSSIAYIDVQMLSKESNGFIKKTSRAYENSKIDIIECNLGSKLLKSETQNALTEKNAECKIKNIFVASLDQTFDIKADSYHGAEKTTSNILVKGVLLQNAKAICRGLVHMDEHSKECDGYQKIDGLLLSKQAEMDTVPKLEIAQYQVKCSHGASIGQVNEEELYYLMSRGLSRKSALTLIIHGFFEPATSLLDEQLHEELHNYVEATMEEWA